VKQVYCLTERLCMAWRSR